MSSSRTDRIKLDTGATTILKAPIPRAKSSASIAAFGLVTAEQSGRWDRVNYDSNAEATPAIGPTGPPYPYVPVSLNSSAGQLHPTGLGPAHERSGPGWSSAPSFTHLPVGAPSRFTVHAAAGRTAPGGTSGGGGLSRAGSGGGGAGGLSNVHFVRKTGSIAAEASGHGPHAGFTGGGASGMGSEGGRLPAIGSRGMALSHNNHASSPATPLIPSYGSSGGGGGFTGNSGGGGGGGGGTVPLPSISFGGAAAAAAAAAASSDAPIVVSYASARQMLPPNKGGLRGANNRSRRTLGSVSAGGDLSAEPSGTSLAAESSGFLRGIRRFFGLDSSAAAAAAAAHAAHAAAAAASEAAAAAAEEPLVLPSPGSVALLTTKHLHELERVNRVRSSLLADANMRAAATAAANSVFVLGAGNVPAVHGGGGGGGNSGFGAGPGAADASTARSSATSGLRSKGSLGDAKASTGGASKGGAAGSGSPSAGGGGSADADAAEDGIGFDPLGDDDEVGAAEDGAGGGGGDGGGAGPRKGGEAPPVAAAPPQAASPTPATVVAAHNAPMVLEQIGMERRDRGRSFTQQALMDPNNPMFKTARKLVQVQEQLSYLEDKAWREKMVEKVPLERPILMAEGWKL
ncbi:hypothetical protein Agub_g11321 [Astrephomene gubernaculifera]|uniref:Uncharacterized protein n=1 Tax=Astrephomene gubernaculifera TaxID=47775 RepID=A0AAD3DYB3_9CHLO|nr:hypothetical protein Agub_g11321 [Astrephomene gubernaculifera]